MITLIKMKYKEWKLKLAFYSMIETVIKEQRDIINTITNLYESFTELAHNQTVKERETEKNKAD